MPTQKKVETVNNLTEKVNKAKSMFFADYIGLKHKQLEELRKILAKVEAEFVVTKNKLLTRALGNNGESAKKYLVNSTATLFNYKDEIGGLKELLKFFKSANLGRVKGGFFNNLFLSDVEINRLATLPSREQLLGQLAGQLNAPITGLHRALSWNINKLVYVLSNIKNKKNN